MKMLFYAFSLSLAAALAAIPDRASAQNPAPAQQPAFPPQGSLKLDRKPLPFQEGPGYFKTFPPAGAAPSADARNRILQVFRTHSVHIMSPDHMPCLVPDMARIEKMPVRPWHKRPPVDHMPIDPGSILLQRK